MSHHVTHESVQAWLDAYGRCRSFIEYYMTPRGS